MKHKARPIGALLPDPFFDSYDEETLTCHDIVNQIAEERSPFITITINRNFLKSIVWSHIHHIGQLAQGKPIDAIRDRAAGKDAQG